MELDTGDGVTVDEASRKRCRFAPMKVHFIAIGGAAMHNLALAMQRMGVSVTGSDDEIFDPAHGRLKAAGLLPAEMGWYPDRIHPGLDLVILGMHAREDNPELCRAQELGLKVVSYPEYIRLHAAEKQRVVVAGSHGKTTITSMILHVLRSTGKPFDYLVGAQVAGFDTMVGLSAEAPVLVAEGDEYLASPLDRRPKMLVYQPHLAVISGIAWDHINVFPTEAQYIHQFALLIQALPKGGMLVWNKEDKILKTLVSRYGRPDEQYLIPYETPSYKIREGAYELKLDGAKGLVRVIGRHNVSNLAAAWAVCKHLGVLAEDFLKAMASFTGASGRLEKILDDGRNVVFKDFAHSPSKLRATVAAVKELFPKKNLIACFELHTFSSLNKEFLGQYQRSLREVKKKVVFVNQHTLELKRMPSISEKEIQTAFDDKDVRLVTTKEDLERVIQELRTDENVFLMMSSGNFAGLDLRAVGNL